MFDQKKQNHAAPMISPEMKLKQQYKTSRTNLLGVIIFTLISMVTIYFFDFYFLFSAYLPFSIFVQGMVGVQIANGTYALMDELTAEVIEYYTAFGKTEFIVSIIIALVITSVYFICWLCSKKHPAAMVVAACFFAIDCAVLLFDVFFYGFDPSMLLDIVFHAWVMYYLIAAIVANAKLKKLPPEEIAPIEGAYTVINGEKVPSASAVPSEFDENAESESNDSNTPTE